MRSVFIALLILNIDFRCLGKCSEDSECYENICLEAGYCRDIRPQRDPGEPIIVDMKYEIDDIISVDIDLKVVGVQISMTQTWIDNRVNVSKKVESQFDNGELVSVPQDLLCLDIGLNSDFERSWNIQTYSIKTMKIILSNILNFHPFLTYKI